MQNSILFYGTTPEEFMHQLKQLIREELLQEQKSDLQERLISPEQSCQVFEPSISKVTLNKWEKAGYLKMYRIGGRTYFRRSEIIDAAKTFVKYRVTKPAKQK